MAKKKNKTITISRPPPGSYDPALDAQQRATQRGLSDVIADVERQRARGSTDFTLGGMDIARQRTELGEDVTRQRQGVETEYGRSLSDLLTQRTQAGEDYTRNLAQLQRNYDVLGQRQAQGARAAGLAAGGAMAQATRKRAANQAWEQQPIETGFKRFGEASATQEQRLGENRQTSLSDILRSEQRGIGALDRAGGELGLGYQRSGEDLTTSLARSQREALASSGDIAEARQAQYRGPVSYRKNKKGQWVPV